MDTNINNKQIDEQQLINNFSWKLLISSNQSENDQNKNIAISPFAIHQLLSITANGALDGTKEEIMGTLGFDNVHQLNKRHNFIKKTLSMCKDYKITNAILTRYEGSIKEEFKKVSENSYDAQVVDLNQPQQIQNYLSKLDPVCSKMLEPLIQKTKEDLYVKLSLINTISFTGTWQTPFDKDYTRKRSFFDFQGKEIESDFMVIEEKHFFRETDTFTAVIKTYHNRNYALLILPKEKGTHAMEKLLHQFEENSQLLFKWPYDQELLTLTLPKFNIEFEKEFSNTLKPMGIKTAFDRKEAQFGGISDDIYISSILQKTNFTVDEYGTTIHCVTEEKFQSKCVREIKRVKFDRPFIFLVINNDTKTTIFQALIKNPSLAK